MTKTSARPEIGLVSKYGCGLQNNRQPLVIIYAGQEAGTSLHRFSYQAIITASNLITFYPTMNSGTVYLVRYGNIGNGQTALNCFYGSFPNFKDRIFCCFHTFIIQNMESMSRKTLQSFCTTLYVPNTRNLMKEMVCLKCSDS